MDAKEFFAAAAEIPRAEVELPEIGGSVTVRGMTASERDAFEQKLLRPDGTADLTNSRAILVSVCALDAAGNRLFSDADVERIGCMRAVVVEKMARKIRQLSGLEEEDGEKKG